jgi:hypothetical protein
MNRPVTAREIIDGIVESMHASLEPLVFSEAAPGHFYVSLRREDYERLRTLFGVITEEAGEILDQEILQLNRRLGAPWWNRLLRHLRSKVGGGGYEVCRFLKPEGGWHIYFAVDDDLAPDKVFEVKASLSDMGVSARAGIGNAVLPEPGGEHVTDNEGCLREGTSGDEGRDPEDVCEETLVSAPLSETLDETLLARPASVADHVYAELSFTDDCGPQLYLMKKMQIVIGRGGREYWVDLKLNTASDVSHEHLRLRYDNDTGQFLIKDLSTFGTTVNGETVASSVEMREDVKYDKDIWVGLPTRATLGLAGVLFLDFRALR